MRLFKCSGDESTNAHERLSTLETCRTSDVHTCVFCRWNAHSNEAHYKVHLAVDSPWKVDVLRE